MVRVVAKLITWSGYCLVRTPLRVPLAFLQCARECRGANVLHLIDSQSCTWQAASGTRPGKHQLVVRLHAKGSPSHRDDPPSLQVRHLQALQGA